LYRRLLAPKAWAAITRYFDEAAQREAAAPFGAPALGEAVRPFYLFSFLAFGFQFGIPMPGVFRAVLRPLNGLDGLLFRVVPGLRRLAWFGVLLLERGGKGGAEDGGGGSSWI
jgi:hypothetical protein